MRFLSFGMTTFTTALRNIASSSSSDLGNISRSSEDGCALNGSPRDQTMVKALKPDCKTLT